MVRIGRQVLSARDTAAGCDNRRGWNSAAMLAVAVCALPATIWAATAPTEPPLATSSDALPVQTTTPSPAASTVASASPTGRPRIGLVLGGGGAKGAAHVGVIRVLEEMRIPVDCIVGTSMGALVGGTYATGMDAGELQRRIEDISWNDTFAFQNRHERLPMRRKLAGVTYSNSLEFGVHGDGLTAPSGFINTQNIEQTIRLLVARSLGVQDFDRLPIPYRAIATDMQRGEMVVLDSGDLATALRASMAVPGIFAPVTIGERVLGDGGLTRNVAVDIARQTCADVVIAVSVPNPIPKPEDLQSPLTMLNRTLDVLVGANERDQLRTLGERDVSIVVDSGDITSGSFNRVKEAIPLGRIAALRHRDELARYSVGEQEYVAWRERTLRGSGNSVQLAEVKVDGLNRVDETYVRARLGLDAGSIVDQRLLSDRIDEVYALGEFDRVQYELTGDSDRPELAITAFEKPWGPNFVRFDVGLQVNSDGSGAFVLGGDLVRGGLNAFGGELHGVLAIGRTSTAELSLYQPFERRRRYFVEPGLRLRRSVEDFFDGEDPVARYQLSEALGTLELGRVFGNVAELRVGLVSGTQSAERDIAPSDFVRSESEHYGGWTAAANFDSRDRVALPTRGWFGRVRYFSADDRLGSEAVADYERLEGLVSRTITVWNDVLAFTLMGGTSFGDEMPPYDQFVLGGPNSFPGLSLGALRGEQYWTGQASYLHKVADISALFGQALYIGAQATAGEMRERFDLRGPQKIYSGALLLGGRTPLGPLTLSFALTSTDEWQIVFGLGRPIEERTIADSEW
jgi:NTE family protein